MGVNQALARYAGRRAHVLMAEVPGNWVLRAQVERRLLRRGWCPALSPADADVLAVCGVPGPALAENLDLIWDQIPGPRVRVEIVDSQAVDPALTSAAAELIDIGQHRRDAAQRSRSAEPRRGGGSRSTKSHEAHRGRDEHMDHDGHHQMDHGEMEMAPAGIALAEGGNDRDGLEMDVLHLRLGPILAHWPSGLVVRCSLQGDVLAGADAWVVDADHDAGRPVSLADVAPLAAARKCDHIVDLLAIAGWPRGAQRARTIRDLLLDYAPAADQAKPLLDELMRTLRRSWVLRWSLRDLAPLSAADLERYRLPAALAGDTYDRLLALGHDARAIVSNTLSPNLVRVDSSDMVAALPDLVRGLDVAAARLVVASLGVDTVAAGLVGRG